MILYVTGVFTARETPGVLITNFEHIQHIDLVFSVGHSEPRQISKMELLRK